jgi:curved DNA-binding protein CbpA
VPRNASTNEIRSAYRKIALKHHPDHSNSAASKAIFIAATEAYDVLSDKEKRRAYDNQLAEQRARAEKATQRPAQPSPRPQPKPGPTNQTTTTSTRQPSMAEEIQKLTKLFQSGRQNEAELLARRILNRDSRQAVPYAVLGDIARGRGNVNEAAKMYAYAMQMDPRNAIYERKYTELLNRTQVVEDKKRTRLEPEDQKVIAPMVGGGVILVAAIYLVLSQEKSVFQWLPPVSTWTFATLMVLFLSGVALGASMALGRLLDRFSEATTSATGRISPTMALGCVSLAQFWFAAALYGCAGLVQKAWNVSTSRLIAGVAATSVALALAAALNGRIDPAQTLIWGGNIVYCGALCGWMVADIAR